MQTRPSKKALFLSVCAATLGVVFGVVLSPSVLWAKKPPAVWRVDPGPPLDTSHTAPHPIWFADGQWVVFFLYDGSATGLWVMNSADGATHRLADKVVGASVSPDGAQVVIARDEGLSVATVRAPNKTPKTFPWPAYEGGGTMFQDAYREPLVSWLDDQTLLVLQRHIAATDEFGFPDDFCHALKVADATTKPITCPEGTMSHVYDLVPGPEHRAVVMSAGEGVSDVFVVKLDPDGKTHRPVPLPAFSLYPAGQVVVSFAVGGEVLLSTPCNLDNPDPTRTCEGIDDLNIPWNLFLWTSLTPRPKRLYSGLPPDSLSDAAARRITWGVQGGLCTADLDPPSARYCVKTPKP